MTLPARSPQGDGNTAPRPVALIPIPSSIPVRLTSRDQWVLWRYERRDDGKWTKVPYQVNRKHAASTRATTWTTFAAVWAAYERGGWDGIGYVLTLDDDLTGIDVDHCRENGHLDAQGQHWVQHLQSYAERSPSGALRIFVEGTLAGLEGRKKGNTECYDSGRFLSVTGHQLDEAPDTIEPRQEQLNDFHRLIWSPKPKRAAPKPPSVPVDLDDQELLQKAMNARKGA